MASNTERPLFIRLSLPEGLEESLETLSKEVLRKQPKNIYQFASQHFEDLLRKRNVENGFEEDKDLIFQPTNYQNGNMNDQDVAELESLNGKEFLEDQEDLDLNYSGPEAEEAASKIQAGYRGLKARKDVKEMKKGNMEDKKAKNTEESSRKAIEIQMPQQVMVDEADEEHDYHSKGNDEGAVDHASGDDDIDIDLEDPEVEKAATKIQAGYKGMKTRKSIKKSEAMDSREPPKPQEAEEEIDIDLNDPEVELAATRIQAGYKGMKTRKSNRTEREENIAKPSNDDELDIDLEDPDVEMAATRIQAGYKGMKTRKDLRSKTKEEDIEDNMEDPVGHVSGDEIDIDLEDPEVDKAATKIQAGYKGMKARKDLKERSKKSVEPEPTDENDDIDIDLNDPEVAQAATRIQAGYKGHMARKGVKLQKEIKEERENCPDCLDKLNSTIEDEIVDIDLSDPSTEKAATTIQAGYKGMKTRKQLKEKEGEGEQVEKTDNEEAIDVAEGDEKPVAEEKEDATSIEGDETRKAEEINEMSSIVKDDSLDIEFNEETEMAATRIQAGYKGHKTRKEMKERMSQSKQGVGMEPTTQIAQEEEEEIDIDLDDPDVEKAATKIQAGFKGHKARKGMREQQQNSKHSKLEDNSGDVTNKKQDSLELDNPEFDQTISKDANENKDLEEITKPDEMNENKAVEVAEAGNARLEPSNDMVDVNTEFQKEREDKEAVLDPDDPDVIEAATQIQAGYRGMKARQNVNEKITKNVEDVIDIDLEDPEVEMAATKIQAGYKGMKTRKEMSSSARKEETGDYNDITTTLEQDIVEEAVDVNAEEEIDIDLEDPEVAKAATTIQSGYRGAKTRQDLRKKAEVSKSVIDYGDEAEVEEAATKIQAGFKGMKARREVKEKIEAIERSNASLLTATPFADENESLTIISEVNPSVQNVEESGAIPYENRANENDEDKDDDEDWKKENVEEGLVTVRDESSAQNKSTFEKPKILDEKPQDSQVMLFHYRASYSSQKVMLYILERGISFIAYNVDLQRNEHLSHWFLELNPVGEVPLIKMGERIVFDSTRIIHTLESQIQDKAHPPLVPLSSETKRYQLHLYFTALLDQIPLNQISHGLAFHPQYISDPLSPHKETLSLIKKAVENRATLLLQSSEDMTSTKAQSELKQKANKFKNDILPALKNEQRFLELLQQTEQTLDKVEEQLKCNDHVKADDEDDECAYSNWLLGESFSACDIMLGIILNKLALMGLQKRFWLQDTDPRRHLLRFLKAVQKRPHFSKSVDELGRPEIANQLVAESAVSVGNLGGGNAESNDRIISIESMDVWKELQKGMTDKQDGERDEEEEERTWKSLW